ncbi:tetratricopeptide repeat protein [Sphingomonas koreensis]|uniref:ATP-binding protein n=1 Tax=Sphingomonas koreensis TaxID=93064 RepID=UPI0009FE6124|nr:ATP-binding protein [Sphingomonas koreensis]PJI90698.1 signal transduction histidine kinase [Sphingomonas koreensis]RSU58509.1 tetratricopeptide repeat protein [Sphingomonas koreensis]RSU66377.1 tetratricopeptide repeat protein [Sphingomonas koreensis]
MRRLLPIVAAITLGLSAPALAQQSAAETLIDRAKAAMITQPGEALKLAGEAERRAAVITDPRAKATAIATALWLQSEASIRTRDSKTAEPRIARALQLISPYPEPSKLRGDLLLARAGVQQDEMRPAEALASLQEAFNIFGAVGEKRSQSIALQTIANLYTEANDFASADKYFRQASEIYEGDPRLLLFLYNNRGNVLLRLERNADASAQYRRALATARSLGSETVLPPILANLARSLISEDKLDEADAVLDEAMEIVRRNDGKGPEAQLLAISADAAYHRGQLNRARSLIERSFAGVDLSQTSIAYRDAHLTAYNIYRKLGESALALPHLERVRKLGDEAAQLATSTNIALMAARFDYANQELRIANLKADEARREAEFQRTLLFGVGGATLIIITLLSIGLFTIRRSRNQVRAANVELGETNVALEKALKAKTEFLATTSHEIRTPLNGILGMTQIMLRDPTVPAQTRDRLGIVHGAGMTMRALVDDILDVAKMETGNLTVELAAADLHAMLRDVTRMWEEQARGKGLDFKLETEGAPAWVETDAGRLRQMLFNLLSNALKFTEKGTVAVKAFATDGRLRIAVSDSGIGIPAEKHEEIFESFRQVDAGTTRKFGGTGLGLAIVRNLARALDGDVSVASVEGEGTTFTVDLPLIEAAAPDGAGAAGGPGEPVIVLDRNPIARGMLRTLLEPHFSSVQFAATPDEALAMLTGSGPALLLGEEATLKAAGDDAVAVLASLAKAVKEKGGRSAVLWVKPDEAMLAALAEAGADTVVAKPVAGAALVEALVAGRPQNSGQSTASRLVSQAA